MVLSVKVDDYVQKSKQEGYSVKKFVYDYDKYKLEQENKTKLEAKLEYLKVNLSLNLYPDQPLQPFLLCLQ